MRGLRITAIFLSLVISCIIGFVSGIDFERKAMAKKEKPIQEMVYINCDELYEILGDSIKADPERNPEKAMAMVKETP